MQEHKGPVWELHAEKEIDRQTTESITAVARNESEIESIKAQFKNRGFDNIKVTKHESLEANRIPIQKGKLLHTISTET